MPTALQTEPPEAPRGCTPRFHRKRYTHQEVEMRKTAPSTMIMIGIIMLFAGGLAAGEPVVASAGSGDAGIIEAVPDGPLELDRRYGHVVGIVYDRSGATVPRATVEIEGRTAGGDEFYARTYTGRTGKFGFRKVPAG